MKAILLAAGKGTRISRMIEEVPKSTLPVAGIPLIRQTVSMLLKRKIEVVVCVGYKQHKIKEALAGFEVKYYENPFYNITNSIASLWFAREQLDDDLLILNADVYFSEEILDLLLHDINDVVMTIDKTRTSVGDYFFETTDNGCIKKYGKELPLERRSCEYVGLAKISKAFSPLFLERMNKLIEEQNYNYWWENILYSFTDAKEKNIFTIDVDGRFWAEIDFFDDYERILNYIEKREII